MTQLTALPAAHPHLRRRLALGSLTLALLLSACGSSSTTAATTTSSEAAVTTSSTTTTAANQPTETTVARTPVSVAATTEMSHLTNVTVTKNGTADRVTFTFVDSIPGYAVSYADGAIVSPGSGETVTVAGSSALEVKMTMASGFDLTGGLQRYYPGPKEIPATGAAHLTELKQVADYEGVLDWAIGVNGDQPFQVATAGNTLTIDIGQ